MKSLSTLHQIVLESLGQLCSVDTARDVITTSRRVEDEGDSYLTITLPLLGKALERGLAQGFWPAQDVSPTWKHVRGLPAYLRGFLSRIFAVDGSLLEEPDAECIWAVRQFVYLTHKVERDCAPERVQRAFDQFVQTDQELLGLMDRIDPSELSSLDDCFERLFGSVLSSCDASIASFELVPRHGPGAVADRLSQKERRSYDYWTERLEDVFPRWRYISNLPNSEIDRGVPMDQELPVRVVSVPKTQSTPRIIAIEPSSVQYAQQGLKREIYELVARGFLNGILGFSDQSRNQVLARQASLTGKLATLDLSEASDRVGYDLVMYLLRRYVHLRDFVDATRSREADVEGHGIIRLNKFASMGSALTFPIEAMVFSAIAYMGIESVRNRRIPPKQLLGQLSVYGDDIIIPNDCAVRVSDLLEHFGAKVNRRKSFWTGKFRESCGSEWYDGHDVSVVRLRHELPSSRGDAAEIAAFVDFRNRMYHTGLWSVVKVIDERLESLINIPYANVSQTDPSPGYMYRASSITIRPISSRWNKDLHREERRVPVLKPHSATYVVDGEAGLLEWFHRSLRQSDMVSRYDSQERPMSFSIQHRWLPWR